MKTIIENGKIYKVTEVKEELNIEGILKENEDLKNKNWNTGDSNTGYFNTGDWNTGHWNTGYWNAGNRNTGYFNIDTPKVRIFGKETDIKINDITFPGFCYFSLTEFINSENMTTEEKQENPTYETAGGYLKEYGYKEAFQKSYNKLNSEDKELQTRQLKELPNFDADIFYTISGIRID